MTEANGTLPKTERENPLTRDIDLWPARKIVEVMNSEDHKVADAISREVESIAKAVEAAAKSLSSGGRVFYVGSGTSGRIAVLDASELAPTFGLEPGRVIPIISGGAGAFATAVEAAEDDQDAGEKAMADYSVSDKDTVIGIASSGNTPFAYGALKAARARKAATVAIVGDAQGKVASAADIVIAPDVGPEVITGSTRLKNGTAQKMVLNMISTGMMVLLGRTYSNLMAGTRAANKKLSGRVRRILVGATGKSAEDAEKALEASGGDLPTALVMLATGTTKEEASSALERTGGAIRKAVLLIRGEPWPAATSVCVQRSAEEGEKEQATELKFASPEEAGFDPVKLERAFDVVKNAVGDGEGPVPGAVALVVRNGMVVGPRAWGLAVRTPERIAVTPNTIFDMASLTKVTATLPSMLILLERGAFRLDDPLSMFIPAFGVKGKESITLRQILTHTAGLPSHLKFWQMGLRGREILDHICNLELAYEPGKHVLYSDLGFIMLAELVRILTGKTIDEFAKEEVFEPLGMKDTCYMPDPSLRYRIAATEFRQDMGKLMWGEVHDENAYALGGIAGHAGLFSTALDMARYAMMWLGEGTFAGKKILSRATVRAATAEQVYLEERRAIGWMMKARSFSSGGDLVSDRAYGHTGFTGTSIWCDPEHNLAVILLTNRVHAGRESNVPIRLRPIFANAVLTALR